MLNIYKPYVVMFTNAVPRFGRRGFRCYEAGEDSLRWFQTIEEMETYILRYRLADIESVFFCIFENNVEIWNKKGSIRPHHFKMR